jgi:hypothetical protein
MQRDHPPGFFGPGGRLAFAAGIAVVVVLWLLLA